MSKVIIIGAGLAGLSAGIYARQSGFEAEIYESHTVPGGASTSWRRKGYLFEGGLHWLTGSSSETPLNRLWREVGALDDSVNVYNRDPFYTFAHEGRTACLYRDVETLRKHFLEISPEDQKEINNLCRDIKRYAGMRMPIQNVKGVKMRRTPPKEASSFLGMLPALMRMPFYAGQTCGEFAARFKSPLLRLLLESMVGTEFSATGLIFTLSTLCAGDGGYPEGGSLSMALRMAEKFKALGGRIHYGKAVSRVCVENGAAKGVVVNGEQAGADAVIVTQDTRVAIDSLFNPPIREPWAEQMRRDTRPMLCTFICLGIEADLSGLPEALCFQPEKPFLCAGVPQETVGFNNYAGYAGYAPEGCTALTCTVMGDSYAFWKDCKARGTYEVEKQKLAESYIALLSEKYPQIAGKVAVWDVATPLTYERYLGSYKGSWMSVMEKGGKTSDYPAKPQGISRLYFAGQRLSPVGGAPVALTTGRTAVQHLCKDADRVFQGQA